MGSKRCPKCQIEKSITDFARNRCQPDGLQSWCKSCFNARANRQAARPENREKAKRYHRSRWISGVSREQHLQRTFGIGQEYYNQLLLDQNGCCAICFSSSPGNVRIRFFHVDHDHETGRIRGLLCNKCNIAVGMLEKAGVDLGRLGRYLGREALPFTFVA